MPLPTPGAATARLLAVEIKISRDYHRFIVRVFGDGALLHSEPANLGNVVRSRNRLAQHWSNHPDGPSVFAAAIPWPLEYRSERTR
jgi:hypothetical protein